MSSFSQRHTKKVWKPNLQTKTVTMGGRKVTLKLSTQAIRTLKKRVFWVTRQQQKLNSSLFKNRSPKTAVFVD